MTLDFKKAAATISTGVLAFGLHPMSIEAATVTYGDLSRDTTADVVVDQVNDTEYTAFDALNIKMAKTAAAIAGGVPNEGRSIVDSSVADGFTAAIFAVASTPCDGAVRQSPACGIVTGWANGAFGESYSSIYELFGSHAANGEDPIGLIK